MFADFGDCSLLHNRHCREGDNLCNDSVYRKSGEHNRQKGNCICRKTCRGGAGCNKHYCTDHRDKGQTGGRCGNSCCYCRCEFCFIFDQPVDGKTDHRADWFGDEVSQREDGVREDRTDNSCHKTDAERFSERRVDEDDC